ncbi:uncharacterized protein TrAFT101_007978 [Trichoderma asperellum]|uniref:uncharacterized protein n=1 Tax=Trichoderma asperellum TaxID=101201 RepID=UPI00332895FF|nr:hypothetical protein TrAFT101_007978 [Trichoderma asperellum]
MPPTIPHYAALVHTGQESISQLESRNPKRLHSLQIEGGEGNATDKGPPVPII